MPDALLGAIAGAVGVWVMDRADWFMYDREDAEARRRTEAVRPDGLDPAHVLANRVASAFGRELSPRQPHPAGIAVHYSLGIAPGALYGVLHERAPGISAGRGTLYGLALTLVEDELLNPVLGLAARPERYPWQAHARGVVAHLVYGVVTDTVFRLLKNGLAGSATRARSNNGAAQPTLRYSAANSSAR